MGLWFVHPLSSLQGMECLWCFFTASIPVMVMVLVKHREV